MARPQSDAVWGCPSSPGVGHDPGRRSSEIGRSTCDSSEVLSIIGLSFSRRSLGAPAPRYSAGGQGPTSGAAGPSGMRFSAGGQGLGPGRREFSECGTGLPFAVPEEGSVALSTATASVDSGAVRRARASAEWRALEASSAAAAASLQQQGLLGAVEEAEPAAAAAPGCGCTIS